MLAPTTCSQQHALAKIDLTMTSERFVAKTQGTGLLDKPRTIDIPLSDLKNFCLVPTIGAQHIVVGTRTNTQYDRSYDSEFIFSYHENGKLKKKRILVNGQNEAFQKLLAALESKRPEASLLHLEPAEAQKQIGVIAASKTVLIIIGLIIGVPVIIALIVLVSTIIGG